MSEERVKRLRLLLEQQLNSVKTIDAIERKIEKLGDDIMSLNNTDEIRVSLVNEDKDSLLLRLRWNDYSAAEADSLRQTLRAMLVARKEEYEARLERAITQEEKRLATLLAANDNPELPASDPPVQDKATDQG